MGQLSYCRHRFPPAVIQHAIWLYLRFTLSYRDVEDLLAERGLEVSYETVRRWAAKALLDDLSYSKKMSGPLNLDLGFRRRGTLPLEGLPRGQQGQDDEPCH